jgi:hypothetical protein
LAKYKEKVNAMRKKKADMSINYIFLIFIATISVFVIIGLITKWSFDAKRFVEVLTGPGDDNSEILDMQIVNVTKCGEADDPGKYMRTEILKQAKICYTKGKEGKVKGTLCYAIMAPGTGCPVTPEEIKAKLDESEIVNRVSGTGQNKVIIGYSYEDKRVEIS